MIYTKTGQTQKVLVPSRMGTDTVQNLENLPCNISPYKREIYHINRKISRTVFCPDYPDYTQLRTLGDHIKRRRLDLKLEHNEVAKILGTNKCTISNWENNRSKPAIQFIPGIIDFLGYTPEGLFEAKSFGEKLRIYRELHGISQKELARQLCVDQSTIRDWENGQHKPTKKLLMRLKSFFSHS